MDKIESFTLDHSLVSAPYIRLVSTDARSPQGALQKYDIRFTQPNQAAIPTAAIHTLEHLLATFSRQELDDVVDVSPMGCRTGFYLIIWGNNDIANIHKALVTCLTKITTMTEIPGATVKECGNYRDHSLTSAIFYANDLLDHGISTNPYITNLT